MTGKHRSGGRAASVSSRRTASSVQSGYSRRSAHSARSRHSEAYSDAPTEFTLPDWSDAASLQQFDDFGGPPVEEEPLHPLPAKHIQSSVRSKQIMASPRKVGEWKRASYALVHEAEQLFEQTNELIQAVQQRTTQTEAKVKAAELAVNTALRTRIQETRRLEQRLDEQVARTEADIDQVETARMTLQSTLTATEAQSSTLNACLEQRMNRPNRELVRDRVEERMESECHQLNDTKSSFSKGLSQLRAEHERLSSDLRSMVIDRDDKSRALRLDEVTLEKRIGMLNRANGSMNRKPSKPLVKAKSPAPKTPREPNPRGGYTPRTDRLRGTPRIAG
jgi:hypothetical protein